MRLSLLHLPRYLCEWESRPRSLFSPGLRADDLTSGLFNKEEAQSMEKLMSCFRNLDFMPLHSLSQGPFSKPALPADRLIVPGQVAAICARSSAADVDKKDSEESELDRRRRLFENFNTMKRKNRLTFETL